jgi:carbon storage regulator CsrA
MLVLSRKVKDKIVFPTLGISLHILRIAGNRVAVGIDAPSDIPVLRHEIAQRIIHEDPDHGHRKRA